MLKPSSFNNRLMSILVFKILLLGQAYSSTVFFLEDQTDKSVRIITFDTGKQVLLHYETAAQPFARPLEGFLSIPHKPIESRVELKYVLKCAEGEDLSLTEVYRSPILCDDPSFMIFSSRKIKAPEGELVTFVKELNLWCWCNYLVRQRSPEEILKLVPPVKKNESSGEFIIKRHDNPNIHYLRGLGKEVKGKFGEMLTKLTLYSFCYDFCPSIYESNSGLDGVFKSRDGKFLIITQSKAGDSNKRAPTVLKNELNEPHIHTRLQLMQQKGSAEVKKTRALILSFLKDAPQNVWKIAHCILDKGIGQIAGKQFDIKQMPMDGTAIHGADDDEKISILQSTLSSLAEKPIEQAALSLYALPLKDIPYEEMLALVQVFYEQAGLLPADK